MTNELFERTTMGLIRELSRGMNAEPFFLHEKYDDKPEGHSPLELMLDGKSEYSAIVLKRVGYGEESWNAAFADADWTDAAVTAAAREKFVSFISGGYIENAMEYIFFVMLPILMEGEETYAARAEEVKAMALSLGLSEAEYDDMYTVVSSICRHPDELTIGSGEVIRRYGPILRYIGVPTKLYMCQVCCCCYDAIHAPLRTLPEDWTCPDCGAGKDSYKQVEGAYTLSRGMLPMIGSRDPGQAKLKPRRQ